MLRSLRIRGFKTLHDVKVSLRGLNVIFGPNAAGKSNLLEAMALLSKVATERTLAEAFSTPLRGRTLEAFEFGPGGLPGLLERSSVEFSLEADVDGEAGQLRTPTNSQAIDLIRYRITCRLKPATGELSVADEYLTQLNKRSEPKGNARMESHDSGRKLRIRRRGKQAAPKVEELGLNYAMLSNRQYGGQPYPEFDSLREELSSWRVYYLDPREAMRRTSTPREVTDIGLTGEDIAPFLYRLKNSDTHNKYFHAIRRAVCNVIPSIESLDIDLDPKRGELDVTVRQEGTIFSSRVMSEGTLRVIALCAVAGNPWRGSVVAFEEPENGVHPQRIPIVAELLNQMRTGGKQVVVTTHSPSLVTEFARLGRTEPEGQHAMFTCRRSGLHTLVEPLEIGDLFFRDSDIDDGLRARDDVDRMAVEKILGGGWLNA